MRSTYPTTCPPTSSRKSPAGPGFPQLTTGVWLYHCGDGAAFLGPAGYRDIQPYPDAIAMLRASHQRLGWPTKDTDDFLRRLDRNGEPTAYLFRCLHCAAFLASWDID